MINRKQYFINSVAAMIIAASIVSIVLHVGSKSSATIDDRTNNNYNSTFSYENNENNTKTESLSEIEETKNVTNNGVIVKNDANTEDNVTVYYSESNNQTSTKKESNIDSSKEENTNTSNVSDQNESKEKTNNNANNQNVSKKKANDNVIEQETDNFLESNRIIIIDKSIGKSCAQAIEYYYEDSQYKYYFTCIKSPSIFVIVNNKEYNIKYALNNGIVTMNELINAGFKPLKESKNLAVK